MAERTRYNFRRRALGRNEEGGARSSELEPQISTTRRGERNGKMANHFTKLSEKEHIPDIDSHLPFPRLSFKTACVLIVCVSTAVYWNSCYGEFVFDDSEAIINNKDLRPETSVEKLFSHDFWGGNLTSNTSHKSYRPLTVLTFRLNYWLAGGLEPFGYHLTNVLINAVVCATSLLVFSAIFGGPAAVGHKRFAAPRASLLAALLFSLHPVHTESVAGVVGRADLACAFCVFLSFLMYTHSCQEGSSTCLPSLFFSVLFCGLALLFKEQGITVLGICCVYDMIIVCRVHPLQFLGLHRSNMVAERRSGWLRELVVRQTTLVVAGAVLLAGRWQVMGSAAPTFQVVDNPASFEKSLLVRVMNYNYIYSLNLWLLACPWWLCFDWSMGCVPLIQSITDVRMLAVLAMWLLLVVLCWYCTFGNVDQYRRLLTQGLALVVVPFLPATNLFFRVGFVVAERVLFLSSVGSSLLVVLGLVAISKIPQARKVLSLCIAALLILYTVRTVQRTSEWLNEDRLFTSGESVCPLNAKVIYNIGKVRSSQGHGDQALRYYREAVRLNPVYDQALNNLGNLLKDRGQLHKAEEMLERAVKARDNFAAGWMNLGSVKASLQRFEVAEQCYHKAIKFRKKYPDAYFNLGNLYIDWNETDRALAAFEAAIRHKHDHLGAWTNRALLLDKIGESDRAIELLHEALQHVPGSSGLHFSLGNMLGQKNQFEEAEKHFLKAIELTPLQGELYGNLGVLYHRWGKFDDAEKYYKKGLKLEPQSRNVLENLQKLERTKVSSKNKAKS